MHSVIRYFSNPRLQIHGKDEHTDTKEAGKNIMVRNAICFIAELSRNDASESVFICLLSSMLTLLNALLIHQDYYPPRQ